jgi:hypothetical protein
MIRSAQNKPVSELLSVDSNWLFRVPRYQREYVWGRDEWENLYDDLLDNAPGYFLGSMICINRSNDSMQVPQELELVDGQQRLATLSILYAAIYSCLATSVDQDDDAKLDLGNLRLRLVFKGQKKSPRLKLSRQGNNDDDYGAILQEAEILTGVDTPRNAGNRRLFKAYRFFTERLGKLDDQGQKVFDAKRLREFVDRLNQASLAGC